VNKKQEIEISAWSFVEANVDGRKVVTLRGYIKNHPKLGNVNDIVTTSAVVFYDARKSIVETMNTIYRLVT
jgi:hypothetical protein